MAAIRTAVIGAGFIGTVHIEALRRIGVQVTGVLASTPERGTASAERLGLARAYGSLDELLSDPGVEVVHVTSPNDLHFSQAAAVLRAGKHVVCEKPLAMTSGESGQLVELASSTNRIAAVNFNIRFYPVNQHARDVVAGGQLGELRLVSGRYFQDWLLYASDWNWRLLPERGGALRAVGDIGSHWLDLISHVTGLRIVSVMADLATFVPMHDEPAGPVETFSASGGETAVRQIATEDVANILLRFDRGARGAVSISQVSPGRKNSLTYEVDGSAGALAWDSEQPDQLWLGHRDGANEILIKNPALMGPHGQAAAALPAGHVEGFADTFAALFRAIYADIAAGKRADDAPYASFADGHHEMLVGDAIAESARARRWVDVPPIDVATREDAPREDAPYTTTAKETA